MDFGRLLESLESDFARLRAIAPTAPTAEVPSSPGWSVTDLTRHVGEVYLHKTPAMREGTEPDPWPPRELAEDDPLVLLDRTYADLIEEFAAHKPEVPDDLAIDGIDELLKVFVTYSVAEWPNYFADFLAKSPGRTCTVHAGRAVWQIRTGPGAFVVTNGASDDVADATVSGARGSAAVALEPGGRQRLKRGNRRGCSGRGRETSRMYRYGHAMRRAGCPTVAPAAIRRERL